jgi:hypothetical protein
MQNIIDYAAYHGYDLSVSGLSDEHRHPCWSKVRTWSKLLTDYDWVWQIDLDVVIMDFERTLETFLDSSFDIIIGRDCYALLAVHDPEASFNSGSFFMKSSAWTSNYLKQVWASNGSDVQHVEIWHENAAMIHVARNDPDIGAHIKLVPGREFNAFPPTTPSFPPQYRAMCNNSTHYEPGDFLVHFPGGGQREKLEAFLDIQHESWKSFKLNGIKQKNRKKKGYRMHLNLNSARDKNFDIYRKAPTREVWQTLPRVKLAKRRKEQVPVN